jgi:hypothetical protein
MLVRGPDNIFQRLRILMRQVRITAEIGGDHGHGFRLAPLLVAIADIRAVAEAIVEQTQAPEQPTDGAEERSPETMPKPCRKRRVRTVSTVLAQLKEWSRKRNWRDRCEAFDREQDRLDVEEMRERHATNMRRAQNALAHPINVLAEALKQEPLLAHQIAESVVASLRRPGTRLPVAYRELMQLVVQVAGGGMMQLATAERVVRGRGEEVARDEHSGEGGGGDDGARSFLGELPGTPAVLAGINALGLGAEGYALVAGVVRLGNNAGSVDAGAAPGPAERASGGGR